MNSAAKFIFAALLLAACMTGALLATAAPSAATVAAAEMSKPHSDGAPLGELPPMGYIPADQVERMLDDQRHDILEYSLKQNSKTLDTVALVAISGDVAQAYTAGAPWRAFGIVALAVICGCIFLFLMTGKKE